MYVCIPYICSLAPNTQGGKSKVQRIRWTNQQKAVMNTYFKEHIRYKKPPKKNEVEALIQENKVLFKEKNWVKIKAYVYNCYK